MEIEFRAWDDKQKYMAYQGTPDLETLSSFIHHFGNDKLMQYTGYEDVYGNKIFVGDIVMNDEWDEPYKIESLHEFIYEVEYSKNHSGLWGFIPSELKIIGNIYE